MADSTADDRLYPARPIVAVSVAVFREGRVLIGRRARAPLAGRFSLPGGAVELGETLIEAAKRELFEETGVEAEIIDFNRHVEPIVKEGGRIRAHFVIASFVGRWTRGEARVSKEIDAVAWIEPGALANLLTTPELGEILESAARIERELR
jgi:8-oxo-dGTP diphosphatase